MSSCEHIPYLPQEPQKNERSIRVLLGARIREALRETRMLKVSAASHISNETVRCSVDIHLGLTLGRARRDPSSTDGCEARENHLDTGVCAIVDGPGMCSIS